MIVRYAGALLVLGAIVGCGGPEEAAPPAADIAAEPSGDVAAVTSGADISCRPSGMPLEDRASPYDSVNISLGGDEARLCYGRPSMRDREVFGALVPRDTIWRTGANEPTTLHLPFAVEIAGLRVDPGSYTLYTVPGENQWQVIVNRSTSQWGIETDYTDEVRAQEVGRAAVPVEPTGEMVETFTITAEDRGETAADLILEWENSRVRVPIERV